MNRLRIAHLADHLEALPILEAWFETEWRSHYGLGGRGDAQADLRAYANRSALPIGVVAFFGHELCGVAALKSESISTHSHLRPWAAAGLVSPPYRRRGIGTALLGALEEIASQLGYARMYCGTSTATRLLERRGWRSMERIELDGQDVAIYDKAL